MTESTSGARKKETSAVSPAPWYPQRKTFIVAVMELVELYERRKAEEAASNADGSSNSVTCDAEQLRKQEAQERKKQLDADFMRLTDQYVALLDAAASLRKTGLDTSDILKQSREISKQVGQIHEEISELNKSLGMEEA